MLERVCVVLERAAGRVGSRWLGRTLDELGDAVADVRNAWPRDDGACAAQDQQGRTRDLAGLAEVAGREDGPMLWLYAPTLPIALVSTSARSTASFG